MNMFMFHIIIFFKGYSFLPSDDLTTSWRGQQGFQSSEDDLTTSFRRTQSRYILMDLTTSWRGQQVIYLPIVAN